MIEPVDPTNRARDGEDPDHNMDGYMNAAKIQEVLYNSPFRPYRLLLDDGEEIVVVRPRKSHLSGDQIALVGECRAPHGELRQEKFRLIQVDRVVSAENIIVEKHNF